MEPVALGTKVPDYLERLSTVLQIKGQQQALRGQAAEVKSAEQSQRQREGISDYFQKNSMKHIGADGTPDIQSMLLDPELRQAAGDQLLDVVQNAATVKQQQLGNMQALTNLRGDQRAQFVELMSALQGDKDVVEDTDAGRQKVTRELIKYGEIHGPDAYPVLKAYSDQLQEAPKGHLRDELKIIGMQGLSASEQAARRQPVYADTGGSLLQTNPNAIPGASPDRIDLSLPPGATIVTDQKGAQFVLDTEHNRIIPVGQGGMGGSRAATTGGARSAPAPNASPSQTFDQPTYVGQGRDIEQQQKDVASVRTQADQAPLNRSIYQKILQLSDDTSTGQLTSFFQKNPIFGQVAGDNYQELSKYLEKNAIANMQAMGGGGSDARLEAATAASGSTKFNPKALKEVTRFNYATNTALEAYREGIDQAVGTTNPKYGELPKFKADWAKNFDIDVFRLENAINDGDEEAKNKILGDLTPAQAKKLMEKRKNLDALRNTGRLP